MHLIIITHSHHSLYECLYTIFRLLLLLLLQEHHWAQNSSPRDRRTEQKVCSQTPEPWI